MTYRLAAFAVFAWICAACGSGDAPPPADAPSAGTPDAGDPVAPLSASASPEKSAPKADPSVKCRVMRGAEDVFSGPCKFHPENGDGSFSLTPVDRPTIADANPVSVTMISPGVADVRGLSADGINSRWGEATRSDRDGACWEGLDFVICAWSLANPKGTTPPPGVGILPEWGKEYAVVYLFAELLGDVTLKLDTEAQKARDMGVPHDAIASGFDCQTSVRPEDVGADPDATGTYVRFDTLANAQAFAAKYPGAKAVIAKDTCGG